MKEIPVLKEIPELINFNTKNNILFLQSKGDLNIINNNELYCKQENIDYISFIPNESIWVYINHTFKIKKYEYVIYMSSYMNIIDHTKHFYRIIQQGGDSEMILCRDENNTNNVNLDVIIFRRSEWTFYKLKQLYWADNISYDIIMDQIYTKYLPKYHINDILVNKGVPYILTNICVYNEHAFNSSRSSFIVNTKISSNKIDIYPWKSIDGYIEIGKNFNNLPNNNLPSEIKIPKYIFQTMETSLITNDIYNNGPLRWMDIHPSYTYFFFDSFRS